MNFRTISPAIAVVFCFQTAVFGQFTLENIAGNRTATIPIGADISIKMPTESAKTDCDCSQTYRGTLVGYQSDTIVLLVKKKDRRFFTKDSVGTQVVTTFNFHKEKTFTPIPKTDVLSITRYYKSRRDLDNIGALIMFLAGLDAVFVGPLLKKDARRINDLAVIGAVGLGFVLVGQPNKKTYSTRTLWRFLSE